MEESYGIVRVVGSRLFGGVFLVLDMLRCYPGLGVGAWSLPLLWVFLA